MEYKDTLNHINDYWELYETTGWNSEYHFTIEDVANTVNNSRFKCCLYEENKLIGFGRVLSDGIHHALIVDMFIHPDQKGKGYGNEILTILVNKCKEAKIRDIQLFSAPDMFGFYEKFGFKRRELNAPGMQFKY